MQDVVITGAARTAMGALQGVFDGVPAAVLGGAAIRAALDGAALEVPEELFMGCVLPAGQGQAPARQAGFTAGLPDSVPAVTVNKMCGSGMATIAIAWDAIALGRIDSAVAGGMESMTEAPYLLPRMRGGARLGHGEVVDHMFLDGLEDAYDKGRLMGSFAGDCASHYGFSRAAQDDYALASLDRARAAAASGAFGSEIAAVTVRSRRGETVVEADEQPLTARPEKIPHLKPAFRDGGTVTAANASSISDGTAALVLTSARAAAASGARIVVTLPAPLEARDLKRGVAAICIGGGEGMAIAIERP